MKCIYCKATIAEDSKICPYCEQPVVNSLDSSLTKSEDTSIEEKQTILPAQESTQVVQTVVQTTTSAPPLNQINANINPVVQSKHKKKTTILLIIIIVIFFLGIVGFTGVTLITKFRDYINNVDKDDDTNEDIEIKKDRNKSDRIIMVYLIGSDLESQAGAATKDITEMIDSQFDEEDIQILMYAGGTKKWHNKTFDEDENAIYEVTNSDVEKIKSYEKKSMTKKSTLTEFLNYVYANYKTDKYSLILWDHGGGPVYGYGIDENDNSGKSMSVMDINFAINDSKILEDGKLEFIGFDACLMSSIEIANILKEEAEYFIASSESEPGDGWDYSFLKEIDKETTTEELGKHVINYYYDYFVNQSYLYSTYGYYYKPALTLSLIDLSKIDNINSSINSLFENMETNISVETYSKIARDVSRATFYGVGENGISEFDLIDLYDFTTELESYQELSTLVQSAIKDAVVYHKTNITDCNGLSMYFPSTTKNVYDVIEDTYKYDDIIISENYKEFLKRYTSISSGDKLIKSDMVSVTPNVNASGIQATLPDDIASNYESFDYLVFRKIKDDGSFLPVYKSKDVSIKGNKISATVTNRRIAVSDAKGEGVEDVIAVEYSRDKDSITYEIVSALEKWDDEDMIGTYHSEVVLIYLQVDNKTKEGKIIDIKKVENEENKTSAKVSYNLNEWKTMKFISSSYMLQDENGNKLDDWEATDTMYGTEVNIEEGYKFFATSFDKDEDYYYMFRVKDTQGNVYETNLVKEK